MEPIYEEQIQTLLCKAFAEKFKLGEKMDAEVHEVMQMISKAPIDNYTKKIAETENWSLQDIYSDEGKSGTSLRKRDAFKRMMRDAKDQKMDLIICASISRFARNFSDCMTQIAALKTMHPAHPIGVYFETENIYTLNPIWPSRRKSHDWCNSKQK